MDIRQFLERAFPDYSLGENLREDADSALFRGRRTGDGRAVLFLTSAAEQPATEWQARLDREYALREDLELPWAARPLALMRPEGRRVLLLEDPGGRPLDAFPSRRFPVAESVRITLGVAACLSRVHAKGLLHNDLKPVHILADLAGGTVALTGFGIATYAARERQARGPLDARSDLHALGVVFYEALTGELPFKATDPSERLHSHLARPPVPPADVDPAIPFLISELVLKLLSKSPEARYQTALGVEADLRRILTEWEA